MYKTLFFTFSAFLIALTACQDKPWHDGEWLYGKNCASCHGALGEGLGELIPPLAGSDYLAPNRDRLPCIVRRGLQDTIVVNGKQYAEPMAAVTKLTDTEITNLLNFINNSWGNQNGVYKLEEVRRIVSQCPY